MDLYSLLNIIIYVFILSSCGSGGSSANDPAQPPKHSKTYTFDLASCATGSHKFSGDDENRVLNDFCQALIDDSLNNDCASEERANLFAQNHCDSVIGTSLPSPPAAEQTSPRGKTQLNSLYKFEDLETTTVPIAAIEAELNSLWTIKTDIFPSNVPEESWLYDIQVLAEDLGACGFDYFGPSCLEGQSKILLSSGTFLSHFETYAYFVFRYSETRNIFSLLFPLDQNHHILAGKEKALLYAVPDASFTHNPRKIFGQKTSLPLITLNYSKLTAANIKGFASKNSPVRSRLRLLFYAYDLNHYFDEHDSASMEMSHYLIQSNFNSYNIKLEDLEDNADHNGFFLYFKYLQDHLESTEYINFIRDTRDTALGHLEQTSLHAQLAIIRQGKLDTENMPILLKALSKDDPDLVRIAFFSLDGYSKIPTPLKIALARLLGDDRENIQEKAAEVLIKFRLDAETIPKITEVIARKSGKPATFERALRVLASSQLIEVNRNVIALLEHRSKDLRHALGLFLQNERNIEEELLPDLSPLVNSSYLENRLLGLTLINNLQSAEATLLLVQKVESIEHNLLSILLELLKKRDNYSNVHIADLARLKPNKALNVSTTALDLMLRIKTPEAANAIIDKWGWLATMNEKNEHDQVVETLKKLYEFKFSLINVDNLRMYSGLNGLKFGAMIDFLISIEGDFPEVTSALVNFIRPGDETQRTKIYDTLAKSNLEGDCLLKLSQNFLSRKPQPEYPDQQFNYDKAKEFIESKDHKYAQLALASAMGSSDPDVRNWAISRLDTLTLDPYIGETLALHLAGELDWNEMDKPTRKGISSYKETVEAAAKFLIRTKSAAGFTHIMHELVFNNPEEDNSRPKITSTKKQELASLLGEYIKGLSSPYEIPEEMLDLITNHLLKYGDVTGRIHIIKLLSRVPRQDILSLLERSLTDPNLNQDIVKAINEVIPGIQDKLNRSF